MCKSATYKLDWFVFGPIIMPPATWIVAAMGRNVVELLCMKEGEARKKRGLSRRQRPKLRTVKAHTVPISSLDAGDDGSSICCTYPLRQDMRHASDSERSRLGKT